MALFKKPLLCASAYTRNPLPATVPRPAPFRGAIGQNCYAIKGKSLKRLAILTDSSSLYYRKVYKISEFYKRDHKQRKDAQNVTTYPPCCDHK